jgi:hypothetical protein
MNHGIVELSRAAEVSAELEYLKGMPPQLRYYPNPIVPPAGVPRFNGSPDRQTVRIRSMRAMKAAPRLDECGFALVPHETAVKDFYDDADVRGTYYLEAAKLVAGLLSAGRTVAFDHAARRPPGALAPERGATGTDRRISDIRRPFPRVHGDYTPVSARQRLEQFFPEELKAGRVRRYGIVNIWRALRGPLRDSPLAVCDARTVEATDLVACEVMYPDRRGEIYSVRHSHDHAWYYAPDMMPGEALVFKTFESAAPEFAGISPHAAFDEPGVDAGAIPRESFEVRVLFVHLEHAQ